jgi:hypothetical protein
MVSCHSGEVSDLEWKSPDLLHSGSFSVELQGKVELKHAVVLENS